MALRRLVSSVLPVAVFAAAVVVAGGSARAATEKFCVLSIDPALAAIDIGIQSTQSLGAWQFTVRDAAGNPVPITGGFGGLSGAAGFSVFSNPANGVVLGVSFAAVSIPAQPTVQVLTRLTYSGAVPDSICLESTIFIDPAASAVSSEAGPCVPFPYADCNVNQVADVTDAYLGVPAAFFAAYGSACRGSVGLPSLVGTGCPSPGQTVGLQIDQAAPGAAALLILGIGKGIANLTSSCLLQNLPLAGPVVPLAIPPSGSLAFAGTIPIGSPPGDINLQLAIADPGAGGGVSATNPLTMHIE